MRDALEAQMARFDSTSPAPAAIDEVGPAITLLYARPPTTGALDTLGARLARIAARYGSQVELQQVTASQLPSPYAQTASSTPTLVVLRNGAIVGEAIGSLPARELECLVRRAVEWP